MDIERMAYRQGEQRIQREAITETVSARSAAYVHKRIVRAETQAMNAPGSRIPIRFSVPSFNGGRRKPRWLEVVYTVEYMK